MATKKEEGVTHYLYSSIGVVEIVRTDTYPPISYLELRLSGADSGREGLRHRVGLANPRSARQRNSTMLQNILAQTGSAKRTLLAVLAILCVAGCARTSSTLLNDSYPPRSAEHPIQVLSQLPTDREYVEVALVDAKGGQHTFADRSTSRIVEQLKVEARRMGADAIVIRSTERGNYNWGQGGWDRSKADAIAIRWANSAE
jgi:hypothetical protein